MKKRDKKGINVQLKDVLRTIWQTKARFLAILLMISLSALVFVGIRETPNGMFNNLDYYQDQVNLHDIKVSSVVGLNDKDRDIFNSIEEIENIEYEKEYPAFIRGKDEIITLYSPRTQISTYTLVEGRMPDKEDEIAVDQNSKYEIGQYIEIEEELKKDQEESLKNHKFKVVGRLFSPEYLSEKTVGSANIGNGIIDLYGVIKEENFLYEEYNSAFLKLSQYEGINLTNKETQRIDSKVKRQIEDAFENRPGEEEERIKKEANEKILDREREIRDGQKKLKDTEEELKKAKEDLIQGRKDYDEGLKTFNGEIKKQEKKILDREREIKDGKKKYEEGLRQYEDGKRELEENKKTLDQGFKELEDGKKELAKKKEELDQAKKIYGDLLNKREDLINKKNDLLSKKKDVEDGLNRISQEEAKLLDNREELINGIEEIDQNLIKIEDGLKEILEKKNELMGAREQIIDGLNLMEENGGKIEDGLEEIDSSEKDLIENKKKIEEGLDQIEENLNKVKLGLFASELGLNIIQPGLDILDDLIEISKEEGLDYELLLRIKGLLDKAIEYINGKIVELNEGKAILEENKADLLNKLDQVNEGLEIIKAKKEDLIKTKEDLEIKKKELEENLKALDEGLGEIDEKERELKALRENLLKTKKDLEEKLKALDDGLKYLEEQKNLGLSGLKEIEDGLLQLNDGIRQINEGLGKFNPKELEDGQKLLDEAYEKLRENEKKLNDGYALYEEGLKKLNDSESELIDAKNKLDQGIRDLNEGKKTLEKEKINNKRKLDDALLKLEDGENEYRDGLKTFNGEKPKALKDIEEGKREIEDSKKELSLLEIPDYSVTSKVDIPVIYLLLESTISFSNFAIVFPIVIYIISVLVTVITMARMVEEERTQIGTMKALGYTRKQISKKYFLYGFLASLLGLVIGVVVGMLVLPPAIIRAYFSGILFEINSFPPSVINILIAGIFAFACTLISTYVVIKKSMKEVTAELMRPKKPSKVKKSFMEYFPFIWKRLSFLWKVSFRNLAMSKAKNVMTIIGIAGCTALLIMGFGIRTSVYNFSNEKLVNTNNYDSIVYYSDKSLDSDIEEIEDTLETYDKNDLSYTNIQEGELSVEDKSYNSIDVRLIVADDEKMDEFHGAFNIQNRKTKEKIEIPNDGVVVSEKLTMILGLDVGDNIKVHYRTKDFELPIRAINENYMEHAIIMTDTYYEEATNYSYIPNTYILKYTDNINEEDLTDNLSSLDAVFTVLNVSGQTDSLDSVVDALDLIVIIIIAISALLTFVVLFNLANLNISERMRELSTVKVLGFRPRELTIYVFRETMVLSALSILVLGLILGKLLHYAIVVILPPGPILLDLAIYPMDVIISMLIGGLFVFITIIIFHFKLKKIDMVEALKAVE